jgi:hypothetical protein
MNRKIVIWGALVALTAGVVLQTGLRTRGQEEKLAQLNAQIKAEEERIRVLTAEWHQLKTPERLEALVKRHMPELDTASPAQMASLVDLPDPLPTAAAPLVAEAPKVETPPKEKTLAVKVAAKKVKSPERPRALPISQRVKPTPRRDELAELINRESGAGDEVLTVIERPAPTGVLWANVEELR